MEDFCRRLLASEARAEALHQAQLALKAKGPDLRHWGAWISQGDPGPLPAGQRQPGTEKDRIEGLAKQSSSIRVHSA